MKFTLETPHRTHIHGYRPGQLTLRVPAGPGQAAQLVDYHTSLIINESGQITDWPVRQAAELTARDLEAIWQTRPEIVLFGSGPRLIFPDHGLRQQFGVHGIGLEVMDTAAACRTYNVLLAEGRVVVAMLIVE